MHLLGLVSNATALLCVRCALSVSGLYCKPDACINGGECIEDPLNKSYQCECPDKYYGAYCEHGIQFIFVYFYIEKNCHL